MKHIVSQMSSYFPNRWPLSYLNLIKNMKTYIRRQQHKKFKHQDIKQKEPPQKYRLGTISNTKLLARKIQTDCKQSLRIGKIRALNGCTGRLFRAATRHNHKNSDIKRYKSHSFQVVTYTSVTCYDFSELKRKNIPSYKLLKFVKRVAIKF